MTQSGSRAPSIRYWKEYLGVKSESDPIIDAISPYYQAGKASAPILLMHGTDDTVVLPEQSRKMAEALTKAGKSVSYLELKGEDHYLSLSETRQQMLTRSAEFLSRCNPAN
jgi:dipeptidyl aminopeptidase/acylaminoacyl peptidase